MPSSEQHTDGTSRLAVYDFLLTFFSDLRGTVVRSSDHNPQEVEQGHEVFCEPL